MTDHIVRGRDTWQFRVPTIKREGANVDLTGAKMWFTVKKRFDAPDPGVVQVTEVSSGSGQIVITVAGSTAVITVNASATGIAARDYLWDLQLKESNGVTSTIDSGKLTVENDVTATI